MAFGKQLGLSENRLNPIYPMVGEWSLSPTFYGYFIGGIPHFQTYPTYFKHFGNLLESFLLIQQFSNQDQTPFTKYHSLGHMFFLNDLCRWNSVKSQCSCSLVRSPISQIVFKWTMPFTSHPPWANPGRYKSAYFTGENDHIFAEQQGPQGPQGASDLALWRHDPQASLFAAVPGLFDWKGGCFTTKCRDFSDCD